MVADVQQETVESRVAVPNNEYLPARIDSEAPQESVESRVAVPNNEYLPARINTELSVDAPQESVETRVSLPNNEYLPSRIDIAPNAAPVAVATTETIVAATAESSTIAATAEDEDEPTKFQLSTNSVDSLPSRKSAVDQIDIRGLSSNVQPTASLPEATVAPRLSIESVPSHTYTAEEGYKYKVPAKRFVF